MTLDEEIEKAVELLSEEEAYELLKGVANDDLLKSNVHFPDSLIEGAKECLKE